MDNVNRKLKKYRRTQQIKRRVILFFLTVIAVIVISLVFFSTKANAQSKDSVPIYKYYKSVSVTSQDTLWGYAVCYAPDEDYERYINEVIRMNNLRGDKIITGMNIVLPYYSTEFK